MNHYEPTDIDRAVCASVGEWHCTPDQRRTILNHADTITPRYNLTETDIAAYDWIMDQDDKGNSAPFHTIQKFRYTFGITGYSGALEWFVDIVSVRQANSEYRVEALRLYREAHPVTEWRYCFNCQTSHTHKWTIDGWQCTNCEFAECELTDDEEEGQ